MSTSFASWFGKSRLRFIHYCSQARLGNKLSTEAKLGFARYCENIRKAALRSEKRKNRKKPRISEDCYISDSNLQPRDFQSRPRTVNSPHTLVTNKAATYATYPRQLCA